MDRIHFMGRSFTPLFFRIMILNIVVIIALTILPQLLIYTLITQNYESEVRQVSLEQAGQLRYAIDDLVLAKAVDVIHLNFSDTFANQALTWGFYNDLSKDPFRLIALSTGLKNITSMYPIIAQIGVFYPSGNVWVDNNGALLLGSRSGTKGFDVDWFNELQHFNKPEWKIRQSHQESSIGPSVVFTTNVPFGSTLENRVAVVSIEVELKSIQKLLPNSQQTRNHRSYVIDSQGHSIVDSANRDQSLIIPAETLLPNIKASPNGTIRLVNQGRQLVVGFIGSRFTDWQFVTIIPIDNMQSRFQPLLGTLQFLAIFLLIFDLIIAFLLTRVTHKPLGAIIGSIKDFAESNKIQTDINADDANFVNSLFKNLSGKINDLNFGIDSKNTLIRQHLLLRLFRNGQAWESGAPPMDTSEILIWKRNFVVSFSASIRFPNEHAIAERLLLTTHLSELLTHSLSAYNVEVLLDEEGRLIGLIGLNEVEDFNQVRILVEKLLSQAPEKSVLLCFGSRRPMTTHDIYTSYQECIMASQAAFWLDNYLSLDWSELTGKFEKIFSISPAFLSELSVSIKTANEDNVAKLIENLGGQLCSGQWTVDSCHNALHDMIYETRKTLMEIDINVEERLGYSLSDYLKNLHGWFEFKAWYLSVVALGCHELRAVRSNFSGDLPKRIEEFIRHNLYNDVSLSTLAEGVDFSVSYLSRIFKSLMGSSYAEYITNTKLDEAERRLMASEISIKELSYKLGYHSVPHFIKLFKAKFGVPPTEYKRMNHDPFKTV